MINKKIIIYPQLEGSTNRDMLYHMRSSNLVEKWKDEKEKYDKKEIGFNHGVIYSYEDPDEPMDFYVYETKSAIIVRPIIGRTRNLYEVSYDEQ